MRASITTTLIASVLLTGWSLPTAAYAQQYSPEQLAWTLSGKLGLAAVGLEAGARQQTVDSVFEKAQIIGRALQIEVPPLPSRQAGERKSAFAARVMHYILRDAGVPIARQLRKERGPVASNLFEMGIKSYALAIIYGPGDETGLAIADVIESRGKRAGLPAQLWQPLTRSIREKAPYEDVKAALFQMHGQVSRHLAQP